MPLAYTEKSDLLTGLFILPSRSSFHRSRRLSPCTVSCAPASVGKPRALVRMTCRLPLTPHYVGCPSPLWIDRGDGDLLLGVEADEAECVLGMQTADRTRTVCDIQQLTLRIKDKPRGLE